MRSISVVLMQHDQFGGPIAHDQVFRFQMQHLRQVFLAHHRVAGGVGLDEIRKVLLEIIQHFGRRVVRVGDKAKINSVLGLFVSHQVRQRWRMRCFIEKMLPQFQRQSIGICAFHDLSPETLNGRGRCLRRAWRRAPCADSVPDRPAGDRKTIIERKGEKQKLTTGTFWSSASSARRNSTPCRPCGGNQKPVRRRRPSVASARPGPSPRRSAG